MKCNFEQNCPKYGTQECQEYHYDVVECPEHNKRTLKELEFAQSLEGQLKGGYENEK